MSKNQPNPTVDLYGNLGGNPESHSVPARTGTFSAYDPILDGVVEREVNLPERNFLTFSFATGGYEDVPLRWHYCVDWEGVTFRLRKGDHVKLVGHFEMRTYLDKKTGEHKTVRQFVVAGYQPIKLKVRAEATIP
jgi:single-stranded DNA-binding protein